MPKLSIIIPAYNAEKYINECIDSILRNSQNSLNQTEIIIINDGSTDHTLEKLEKYKEYKNIHIYTTKNQGVSAARNYGIKLAKGNWITFIDADDKVTEGFIHVCKLNICEETSLVILNQQNKLPLTKEELIKKILSTENFLAAPFLKLYSTKFLEQEQILFDSRVIIGEDLLFNLSVILKSRKIEYEDIKYYLYRQNNTSATKTFNPKLIESDKNFYRHLAKLFETQKNITLDWTQIRSDAEEQFNDKTLYPMSDYIDMAFKADENRVLLIWSLSNEISDDEALAYGTEYIKAVNDYAATQDFSIEKSSENSYGGLFDKYDLEVQLFREDDIMENSRYIVNQVIEAGTNTNLELQNKKGDK